MDIPDRPVHFVPAKAGEVLKLGTMRLRVMEDGSNTGTKSIPSPVYPPQEGKKKAN